MSRNQYGHTHLIKGFKEPHNFRGQLGVKVTCWFVGNEKLGPGNIRSRYPHSLLFTTGQCGRIRPLAP